MSVKLIGEANDYVGKGMAGGDIVIVPPPDQTLDVRAEKSKRQSYSTRSCVRMIDMQC